MLSFNWLFILACMMMFAISRALTWHDSTVFQPIGLIGKVTGSPPLQNTKWGLLRCNCTPKTAPPSLEIFNMAIKICTGKPTERVNGWFMTKAATTEPAGREPECDGNFAKCPDRRFTMSNNEQGPQSTFSRVIHSGVFLCDVKMLR